MEIIPEIREKRTLFLEKTGMPSEAFNQKLELQYNAHADIQNELLRQKKALQETVNHFKREFGPIPRKSEVFRGIVLGYDKLQDRVSMIRAKAKKVYEQDAGEAIATGLTAQDGTALDTRDTVNFKKNPRYGLPIEGHDYYRTLFFCYRL